jgi:hypothetical protein
MPAERLAKLRAIEERAKSMTDNVVDAMSVQELAAACRVLHVRRLSMFEFDMASGVRDAPDHAANNQASTSESTPLETLQYYVKDRY